MHFEGRVKQGKEYKGEEGGYCSRTRREGWWRKEATASKRSKEERKKGRKGELIRKKVRKYSWVYSYPHNGRDIEKLKYLYFKGKLKTTWMLTN